MDQVLGNLITLLVALASLALFVGAVLIANAVALAMLERRREQAVLTSVGYTSGRVLAGVIGGLGGVLGMILAAVVTVVLAKTVFKATAFRGQSCASYPSMMPRRTWHHARRRPSARRAMLASSRSSTTRPVGPCRSTKPIPLRPAPGVGGGVSAAARIAARVG